MTTTEGTTARTTDSAMTSAATRARECSEMATSAPLIRDVLDRIADKWSMRVIRSLDAGPLRFGMLKAAIPGISQRMLTVTVRNLERDGIVSREIFAEVPPRVEYRLTGLGESLRPVVIALATWVHEHDDEIRRNHATYDELRELSTLG